VLLATARFDDLSESAGRGDMVEMNRSI